MSNGRFMVMNPSTSLDLVFLEDLARDDSAGLADALDPMVGLSSITDVSSIACFYFLFAFLCPKVSLADGKLNFPLIISSSSDNSSVVRGYNSLPLYTTRMACRSRSIGNIKSKGGTWVPYLTSSTKFYKWLTLKLASDNTTL